MGELIESKMLLDTAREAARAGGKIVSELAQAPVRYSMKNAYDIQAEADVRSEQAIKEVIRARFPEHSILAEEAGLEERKSEYCWAVDPLDGTINFSRGISEYCVSIACARRGELLAGVVYDPVNGRLYEAQRGGGALCNGRKLSVSVEPDLLSSLVACDNSSKLEARMKTFDALTRLAAHVRHVRILGSGALHLARLAEGQLDGYFKMRSNFWDYAAGVLLVTEAGGRVTDVAGKAFGCDSREIVASNGRVHEALLKALLPAAAEAEV